MMTFLVAQLIKHLPTMWETRVRSLGWKDPLEKAVATHSIIACRIPLAGAWRATVWGYKESGTTE